MRLIEPRTDVGLSELRIRSPWGHAVSMEFPEWIESPTGDNIFFNRFRKNLPKQFAGRFDSRLGADGEAYRFDCALAPGIGFQGEATSLDERTFTFALRLANATDRETPSLRVCVCYKMFIPGFDRNSNDNSLIFANGKWQDLGQAPLEKGNDDGATHFDIKGTSRLKTRLADGSSKSPNLYKPIADVPVIVRKAENEDRYVVVSWRDPCWGTLNGNKPCIHINPAFPACAAGETRSCRGVMFYHEGEADGILEKLTSVFPR